MLLQISLIIASFLTLFSIESEKAYLGESINIAGMNRFLTSMAINDFYDLERSVIINYNNLDELQSLEKLRKNIILLKEGGNRGRVTLEKLPLEFEEGWTKVYNDFLTFEKSMADTELKPEEKEAIIKEKGMTLIESSDLLVMHISESLELRNVLLIRLQIVLLFINTIAHILLVILIFRILNKETEEKLRLEKFATIGKIGATIAHDLRNPLTVIKGSFELLKMNNRVKDKKFEEKQLDKIQNAIKKIEYITKDILDFSQTRELKKEEINLLEIIKETIMTMNIPDRIRIKLPRYEMMITADKIKLQIMFTNLIKNAIEAIDEKGTVTIEWEENTGEVTIIISDTGHGLPKQIEKIVEPTYTTKITGSGLGLSSSYRIIKEHNGTMTIKRNPTTVIITLPKK